MISVRPALDKSGSFFYTFLVMYTKKKEMVRKTVVILAVVVMIFLLIKGYYTCPVRFLFGYKCPFCGICRAVMSAFKGDMKSAFYYHPLWPVIVPVFILEILDGLKVIRIPKKVNDIGLCIGAVAMIVCYIVRIMTDTLI